MLVLDTTLAITFGAVKRLELVTELRAHRVGIASRAAGEVLRDPAAANLRQALDSGTLERLAIDLDEEEETAALKLFDARPAFRGRGDAEVLALATARGLIVGSDDRAVRAAARRELGPTRVAGSLDVIVWALREDRLLAEEGERLLNQLDSGPAIRDRLRERGQRLSDLV